MLHVSPSPSSPNTSANGNRGGLHRGCRVGCGECLCCGECVCVCVCVVVSACVPVSVCIVCVCVVLGEVRVVVCVDCVRRLSGT